MQAHGSSALQFPYLLNMLCELSLLFNKKEGVEEQFPEVVGNSQYEKLWYHLDKRQLRAFGSTNEFTLIRIQEKT